MLESLTDKYLNTYPIPPEVFQNWNRWEGVSWRIMRYGDKHNGGKPQDQRFTVGPPAGMCPIHLEHWHSWRNRMFDPYSGNRWPGHPGSPFLPFPTSTAAIDRLREERRWEWDVKTIEQMQLIESICLSGRSPQCDRQARS